MYRHFIPDINSDDRWTGKWFCSLWDPYFIGLVLLIRFYGNLFRVYIYVYIYYTVILYAVYIYIQICIEISLEYVYIYIHTQFLYMLCIYTYVSICIYKQHQCVFSFIMINRKAKFGIMELFFELFQVYGYEKLVLKLTELEFISIPISFLMCCGSVVWKINEETRNQAVRNEWSIDRLFNVLGHSFGCFI